MDEGWAGAGPPSVAEEMVSFRKNWSGHLGTNFLMNKALKPKEKQIKCSISIRAKGSKKCVYL